MLTGKIADDFDGFILPDGEMISIKDADRMFSFFAKCHNNQNEITSSLWALSQECWDKGYHRAAYDYLEKILSLVADPSEKVKCLVRMGAVMEEAGNYRTALEAYLRAFDMPQKSNEVWYFLNNNVAYCLNQRGKYTDAERYCRVAINIDPYRHNAYKNLGIALQHQGQYAEAARSLIHAARLCPADVRAFAHLEDLIAGHREILVEVPDLLEQFHECYQRVQGTKGEFRVQ